MEEKTKVPSQSVRIAVVRVRGDTNLGPDIKKSFELLRLYRKNYCVVVTNSKTLSGMVYKIKDFVTFGELDKETFVKLLQIRGKIAGDKPLTETFLKDKTKLGFKEFADAFYDSKIDLKSVPGVKQFFRLHPPIGGFEREGIKRSYAEGGTLGYRGKAINKLIERMIK